MFTLGIGIICFALGMYVQNKLYIRKMKEMKDATNKNLSDIAKKLEES